MKYCFCPRSSAAAVTQVSDASMLIAELGAIELAIHTIPASQCQRCRQSGLRHVIHRERTAATKGTGHY